MDSDQEGECKNESMDNSDEANSELKSKKVLKLETRRKKSVQFADGVMPGEGTSPSGGEGDMPSPPPPSSTVLSQEAIRELSKKSKIRRSNRKKQKKAKLPKTKKKVKVPLSIIQ